ncbi:MAG TPA: chloride channel protein [Desulfobacteraceae bacterium]|nr:chloride channel protein [Desulfobacteraceae bacterium]
MKFILSVFRFFHHRLFVMDDRLILILAGIAAGMSSGLAAVALRLSLEWSLTWLEAYRHLWWAVILPGAGACLSSIYLEKGVRECAGHGVPEVIYAVSRYGGLLRFRSTYSRLLSSFLTIGSGGSAGPEAPVVMSGSAIGSNIGKWLKLNDRQRVTLVGCGAAGAIAAIFNAPLAGLVFSVEVILGEWKIVRIIPIAIAAVAGAEVSLAIVPEQVLFHHQPFDVGLRDVMACLCFGAVTALVSIAFMRVLRLSGTVAKQVPLPFWAKAFLGGCAVGVMALGLPVIMGEGYHHIQAMISGHFSLGLSLTCLALGLKMLATAMTLGWGGSGGVFAPCLVLGSLTGVVFHSGMTALLPESGFAGQGAYALIGMTGLISGVMQAPLTGIFLILEITNGYETILPLIAVSAVSSTISHYVEPASFYFRELIEKGQFLRPGTDARILADLNLSEVVRTDYEPVDENMVLRDFIAVIKTSSQDYFPVISKGSGAYRGMIRLSAVRAYALNPMMHDMVLVSQIMDTGMATVSWENDLGDVIELMDLHRADALPVVEDGRFGGMILKTRILDLYRRELIMQTSVH